MAQKIQSDNKNNVLVLYSGGRDSSCAAVEMAKNGNRVRLYTYQAGALELVGFLGDSAPDIRHKELIAAFPEYIEEERIIEGSLYLIRKLAIERTNKIHVVYPIALALAVHAGAIVYCIKNGLSDIVSGYSGYQAREDKYIEQRADFIDLTKAFLGEYGIRYHTPVIDKEKDEVMDILERHNISSNSLENKSVFGGIYFDPAKALDYWNESIPVCRQYISNLISHKEE